MLTIQQTYQIGSPGETVWQALVDPKIIAQWSGDKAVMDAKEGTKFTLWSGEIYGTNLELVPNKKLVQEWLTKGSDKKTKVTISLKSKDGGTEVSLSHKNISDQKAYDDFADGWQKYFFGPMKKLLESEVN